MMMRWRATVAAAATSRTDPVEADLRRTDLATATGAGDGGSGHGDATMTKTEGGGGETRWRATGWRHPRGSTAADLHRSDPQRRWER